MPETPAHAIPGVHPQGNATLLTRAEIGDPRFASRRTMSSDVGHICDADGLGSSLTWRFADG